MKTKTTITYEKDAYNFDRIEDVEEWMLKQPQTHALFLTSNKKMFDVRYMNFELRPVQSRINAGLDTEARHLLDKTLDTTHDNRTARLTAECQLLTVKELKQLVARLSACVYGETNGKAMIQGKMNKAQLVTLASMLLNENFVMEATQACDRDSVTELISVCLGDA